MRLYGLLGGNYVVVCKACGKLGGSGDMLPPGNFNLLDVIWWNLGLFSHTHNLPFIVLLKLL